MTSSPRSPVTSLLPSMRDTLISFSPYSAHQCSCLLETFNCHVWKQMQTNHIKTSYWFTIEKESATITCVGWRGRDRQKGKWKVKGGSGGPEGKLLVWVSCRYLPSRVASRWLVRGTYLAFSGGSEDGSKIQFLGKLPIINQVLSILSWLLQKLLFGFLYCL